MDHTMLMLLFEQAVRCAQRGAKHSEAMRTGEILDQIKELRSLVESMDKTVWGKAQP